MRQVAYKTWAQGRLARKNRPARPLQQHFREKTRPAQPLHWHFREKVLPASVKTPILGCFERAGRTFSRARPPSDHAGRTFSRTRRDNMATLKPTTPLHVPEQQPLKPPSPLHPKTAPKTPILHPQRRRRFQTGPPGRQGQAAVPTGSNDTTASQISHVIYRGHFSRHPKNVAIPTMQIQCLNKSQGNYVRN